MKKTILAALLLGSLVTGPLMSRESGGKTKIKNAPTWQDIQNKHCGFYLRYPKGSKLERPGDCALKITFPPTPGAEWISETSLTLEVTAAS